MTGGRSSKRKGSTFERELALALGGKRTPLSGASGGGDITLEPENVWHAWSWEAKRRATLPKMITDALAQAEHDVAIGDQRRPAVAMREDHGRTIAVFYLEDLVRWIDAITELGNGPRPRDPEGR